MPDSLQNPFALIEHDPAIVFALDRELRIIYCNEAWDRFAQSNGGTHLKRPQPHGRCVLDVVPEPLKHLYRQAYERVFATWQQWVHEYECSSDMVYRLFRMTVIRRPKDDFILSVNFLLEERPHGDERPGANPDSMTYGAPDDTVVMCCVCRRTRRRDRRIWDWVPAFVKNPPTRLAHRICEACDRETRAFSSASPLQRRPTEASGRKRRP